MNAYGPLVAGLGLLLVVMAIAIFIPGIRERIREAVRAQLAALPRTGAGPADPLAVARQRAVVAWERFQTFFEDRLLPRVVRFARGVSVFQVVSMALAMLLAAFACDASVGSLALAGVVALLASGVLLWNAFIRTSPLGPNRAFSPTIFMTVGPTAWCVMGDVFMWVGRPHGDERIDILGALLFIGGLMSFELIGVMVIELVDVGAKAFEGGLNLFIRFARLFLASLGPEMRDFFVLANSDVFANQEWRKEWKAFWRIAYWAALPFPLLAMVDQSELVAWAAFFISLFYGVLWKLEESAGFDVAPAKKAATRVLAAFAAIELVRKVLEHASPGLHEKLDMVFQLAIGIPMAGADTALLWIAVSMQVLATTSVLGAVLYGLSKIPSVREHSYFNKGVVYSVLGFVAIMFYMLAPSAIARISEPTRAQVFAASPGVLISWDTSFRGDGVVIQARDQRGGKFKSIGWVEKRANHWRYIPEQSGNYAYVACFVESGPSCAHDICLPEEIPPLQAGALCYEETPLDVPAPSTVARTSLAAP